ncbi:MAG: hypothetical protein WA773_22000, partial [Bradyrhizobium sp.]
GDVPFGNHSSVLIFYASSECLLRLATSGMIILARDNKARRQDVGPDQRAGNAQASSVVPRIKWRKSP